VRPKCRSFTHREVEVEGPRPPGSWLVNRYLDRVHAAASDDATVCRKFFDVLNLLAPLADVATSRLERVTGVSRLLMTYFIR
jgi:hypothetical protein